MPRLLGAASASVFAVLVLVSYAAGLRLTPLPIPAYILVTILFITSTSAVVSFVAARAYMKQRLPSLLFLGSGSLFFGSTSFIAAVVGLPEGTRGSNVAVTVFVVGAALSAVFYLASAGSRPLGGRGGRGAISTVALFFGAVLALAVALAFASFRGELPAFLVPGSGTTPLAKGLLATSAAAMAMASLLVARSSLTSEVLSWYSAALAVDAVGILGLLISGWTFESGAFLIGRAALAVAGIYMLMSVRAAARSAWSDPDSVVRELFKPMASQARAPRPGAAGGEGPWTSVVERSVLMEVDPASSYERAVQAFADEMASLGRTVVSFTSGGSPVNMALSGTPGVAQFLFSDVPYPRASPVRGEVMVPRADLPVLLGVVEEVVETGPTQRKAVVFDNVSSLAVETGFSEAYKFIRRAIEISSGSDVVSLYVMVSGAHGLNEAALIRNLFAGQYAYDSAGLRQTNGGQRRAELG